MRAPPDLYMEKFFLARRRVVERLLSGATFADLRFEILKNAFLLSPMVATCGPAGPNAAPFMVSFLVKEEYLEEAVEILRGMRERYWGKGQEAVVAASRFLLEYVYNPERSDPLTLVSHLMSRGHTYVNIEATGRATLGILIPPDEGALELRTKARIVDEGLVYEYVNLLHDSMHAVPEGRASHPWYPAVVFEVEEIYDNSYTALGRLVWRRDGGVEA